MRALLEERAKQPSIAPVTPGLDAFLASLDELFQPDRVNAHLWHCRTQEEFDEARDALDDYEDDLRARPELDGGNDGFFTDRN
jgi:hypothetical protein